jgi:hypothetical protein
MPDEESKCQLLSISLRRAHLPCTPDIAEALISAALTHLDLNGLAFDKSEMERLFACLLANSSITKLGLVRMLAFVKYLPGMSHVRSLTLEGNEFGEAGERALVQALDADLHCLDELRLIGKPSSLQIYIDFLLG